MAGSKLPDLGRFALRWVPGDSAFRRNVRIQRIDLFSIGRDIGRSRSHLVPLRCYAVVEGVEMTTTTQSVRDIALENPSSIRVFEKYGIDYCCGGRAPLTEACAAKNIEVDAVNSAAKIIET